MRILFLDDNQDRHDIFLRRSVGCVVDQTYTAQQAMDLLASEDENRSVYDLVMLDHDLGGPESENLILDNDDDGRTVARFIAKLDQESVGRFAETTFVIHSLNSVGREQIAAILRDRELAVHEIPFGWKKFTYDKDMGVCFS